jgi:phosphoribosylglycinamide formyltransferase 1
MTEHNIIILVSGAGSNMRAMVQAAERERWGERYGARVAAVVSNRPASEGLAWARQRGLPTELVDHTAFAQAPQPREAFDAVLASTLLAYKPSLVLLAGFMRILTPAFITHFEGKILNIHPSLLPAFPGLHTHQRALDAGCTVAGATVHEVTAGLDAGPILAQACVPVMPGDTADCLAERVLTQEHLIYPQVVRKWLLARQSR